MSRRAGVGEQRRNGFRGIGGGSGPLWTPESLSTSLLRLWLDGDAPSTVTLSGSEVTSWASRVNGYTYTQGTAANRPTTRTVNSRVAIDFDGTNDRLEGGTIFGNLISASAYHVLAALDIDAIDTTNLTLPYQDDCVIADVIADMQLGLASNGGLKALGSHYDGTAWRVATGDISGTGRRLIDWDFTGGTISTRVDAGSAGTAAAANVRAAALAAATQLGANSTDAQFFDGAICEMLVCNAQLSAADRANARAYLARKWGVTA